MTEIEEGIVGNAVAKLDEALDSLGKNVLGIDIVLPEDSSSNGSTYTVQIETIEQSGTGIQDETSDEKETEENKVKNQQEVGQEAENSHNSQ